MTILCLVTNDLSHDQRMIRICGTLAEAGYEVTLIGRELPDSPALVERPFRQHRIRCRYHTGKLFYAEYNYRLWRELRDWTYDVICAVDLDTLLAATLLRRSDTRIVYDAHEWFSETPEVAQRPLIRGAWRGLGRALVPRTDARYTVGPALAARLAADYGVPFETVRNVPRRSDQPLSENPGGVILYQGMLNPGRGLDVAIRAVASLSDCELWIVGDGPERPALESLSQDLQVQDRVHFKGFHPPSELASFTRRAWLGINLLAGDSQSYYYSLANKSLDYIQAGLPSVQMDFPEYRAINAKYQTFVLLPECTAPALVAKIQALRHDPTRYALLRQNCVRAAAKLCWESEAARLLAIYRSLERPA